MSKSVVPAAANADVKALAAKQNSAPVAEGPQPARDDQDVIDAELEEGIVVESDPVEEQSEVASETALAVDSSFEEALIAAADSAASLISEAEAVDEAGFALANDDGDGSGIILLVGALGLVGLGVAALAGGGGGPSNSPPAYGSATQAVTTDEDTPKTITAAATDPDGDVLTYTNTAPTKGTVTAGTGGSFTYTPNADVNGTDSFTVTATDPSGESTTQTINITINPVNDAPGLGPNATTSLTIAEDTSGEVIVDVVDIDSPESSLSFSVTTPPANGTFALVGGANTYTPNADFNGSDSIVIQLTDGSDTFTYTVDITVTPVNDAPTVAATQNVTVDEDASVAVFANASDVDGDTLAYNVSDPANGEVVTGTGGNFTYMPDPNFNGSDSFTITVSDPGGLTAQQVVNVTVNPTPEIVSLDVVGPNPTTPAQLDAGTDEFIFQETAAGNTNVIVANFGLNDLITVSGATSTDYNFGTGTDPNDLQITFNPGSSNNIILLDDILIGLDGVDDFIFNYDTAVAAVQESLGDTSFVFMTFA